MKCMLRVMTSLVKHSKRQMINVLILKETNVLIFLRDRYFIMVRELRRLLNFNIFWCKQIPLTCKNSKSFGMWEIVEKGQNKLLFFLINWFLDILCCKHNGCFPPSRKGVTPFRSREIVFFFQIILSAYFRHCFSYILFLVAITGRYSLKIAVPKYQ